MTVVSEHAHTDPVGAFVPDQSRAERKTSYDVADFPMPSGREEDWRFTPVDRLGSLLTPGAQRRRRGAVRDQRPRGRGAARPAADRRARGPVVRAGRPRRGHRLEQHRLGDVHRHPQGGRADRAGRRCACGAPAAGAATATPCSRPGGTAGPPSCSSHTGAAQHAGNVEIGVGDGAELTVVSVQEWDDDAIHLAQHDACVGRDARLKHITVTLGGAVVRINTNVRYGGPGGSAEAARRLLRRRRPAPGAPPVRRPRGAELHLAASRTRAPCRATARTRSGSATSSSAPRPRAPTPTSSTATWSSPTAPAPTRCRTSRSRPARSSAPGTPRATGRFDDEQLFYLQARGIPEDEARAWSCAASSPTSSSGSASPTVQERLMAAIDAELALSIGAAPAPRRSQA